MANNTGLFRRHVIGFFTGTGLFILAVVLSPMVSYQIGKLEARQDFLNGKRQLKWCGGGNTSRELTRELKSILRSEFGVETVPAPFCSSVLPPLYSKDGVIIERVRGYNYQQAKELERIYGRDVVEETVTKIILCDMVKSRAESVLPDFDH